MNSGRGGFDSSFDSQNSYMSGKSEVFDPKMNQYGQFNRQQNNQPQSKGLLSSQKLFAWFYLWKAGNFWFATKSQFGLFLVESVDHSFIFCFSESVRPKLLQTERQFWKQLFNG